MDRVIQKPNSLVRFWLYCLERFPPLQHGLIIAVFTFSAAAYSRILRGADGMVPWNTLLPGMLMVVSIFFLLRLFDEFKDKEEDKKYRPHLPVPRGLVSLDELKIWILLVFLFQAAVLIFLQSSMWLFVVLILVYLLLMRAEFFVPAWLKKRPMLYMLSHMLILPFTDWYATGLDWHLEGTSMPAGLIYFLILSYLNGMVIEVGRKIRPSDQEEPGQRTYSSIYGSRRAALLWIMLLILTFIFAQVAAAYAGFGWLGALILSLIFLATVYTGLRFLRNENLKYALAIEKAAGLWTLGMYLVLGAFPMLINLIKNI